MGKRLILGLALVILVATCVPTIGNRVEGLTYKSPMEINIGPGEFLPGTDIQYLGKTEDGAQVSIGGQQALKKIGDSLSWEGDLLDGASLDLDLRLALIAEEKLHLLGTAQVVIPDPAPQPGQPNRSAPIHYKLVVDHHIKKGQAIPGTQVLYIGETADGARLANIDGYPYRKVGDSIVWEGQIRDRIWLELNLRAALVTEGTLNVAGTADLWVAP